MQIVDPSSLQDRVQKYSDDTARYKFVESTLLEQLASEVHIRRVA